MPLPVESCVGAPPSAEPRKTAGLLMGVPSGVPSAVVSGASAVK